MNIVNVLKSVAVLVFLLFMVGLSVRSVLNVVRGCGRDSKRIFRYIGTVICVGVALISVVFGADYIYPFERPVNPVLIAEFDVPEEYALDYPGEKFWHGAYKAYGIYPESLYFDPDKRNSIYGFGWPPMDFETYNYIITYGQKIDSLSYNVWDTIDIPVYTGAKVGHMVLEDSFSPRKVYVYRIPKVRIDNDINSTD